MNAVMKVVLSGWGGHSGAHGAHGFMKRSRVVWSLGQDRRNTPESLPGDREGRSTAGNESVVSGARYGPGRPGWWTFASEAGR